MLLFEEAFADLAKLSRDWIMAPGMVLRNGVLAFSPDDDEQFCVGITRRHDFSDFAITVDVRIVCAAAGLVLRAVAPGQYYMVQFDLANNPSVVWFHTFTPSEDCGYRLELVPSALVPSAGIWHRMRVVVRADSFEVFLGQPDGPLLHCASWLDRQQTYRQGAVGIWESGGEAAEYRGLCVDDLAEIDA
jgi:hypothetical protein